MEYRRADSELETRYETYRSILKDLTIMSDMFMRNVFKKRECTEYVLQVIMGRKDLKVVDQVLQLRDFHCKDAGDIHSEVLARRVRELKETQEGVDFMCREMDKIYSAGEEKGRVQGIVEGLAEGEMKKARETALTLAERGMSVPEIADIVKISVKLVQKWLDEHAGSAG